MYADNTIMPNIFCTAHFLVSNLNLQIRSRDEQPLSTLDNPLKAIHQPQLSTELTQKIWINFLLLKKCITSITVPQTL